jgi:hypothetical protein
MTGVPSVGLPTVKADRCVALQSEGHAGVDGATRVVEPRRRWGAERSASYPPQEEGSIAHPRR